MLRVLRRQTLRFALTVPNSTVRLRFSSFPCTTSQHKTSSHYGDLNKMEKMNG